MGMMTVISTLDERGHEVMGPDTMIYHFPSATIVSGSLLTVESNHFCVLKSRGAILNVYETGQYPITTGDKPLVGSFVQGFFGGQSPWQYEALYVNRAKLVVRAAGLALSKEMAEMRYDVDYYVHVSTRDGALKLVQHMPYAGHKLTTEQLNNYAGPVVEQAINQIVQVTPLEQVNEKIHELTQLVREHLAEFLDGYGITLDTVKVLVRPSDERMRGLIALKAFGLSELDAVRYYSALVMAERGVVTAPNMAIGAPFNVGGNAQTTIPSIELTAATATRNG
ncbi:MAG: SPFH domain-containing protein [Deltaproteobacteria bacterium]|nr:SPFH domain-containing protein [Deltaproteobacteria bacterium]